MKLSHYIVSNKEANEVLVYSTKNGDYVIMKDDEYLSFLNISCDDRIKNEYLEMGFYVEDDENEFETINKISSFKISKSKVKKYRILTTSSCNARCPYCYEKGIKHHTMNLHTSLNVAKFILKHANENDKIRIEWFGGEPLLNCAAISLISEYIQKHLPSGCSYRSSIVSNGFCINDEVIKMMKNDWNLKRIQITIDGIEDRYEHIKQLGTGSFNKLINNIRKLVNADIKVDIRLNFDQNNLNDIKDVIHFLSRQDFKNKIEVYAAKLFSKDSKCEHFDLESESNYIDTLLYDNGFINKKKILPKIFTTPCMAAYPSFFTIDPQGRLFKCDRLLLEENVIATVSDYSEDCLISSNWTNNSISPKCHVCKLFPLCWGGCFYDRLSGIYPCCITESIVKNRLKLLYYSLKCE